MRIGRWAGATIACSAAVVASLIATPVARANGRFPRAERLIEDPRDPNHLLLAATYGIVLTTDRGAHWYHLCEKGFSLRDGYSGDPILERTEKGTVLVGVETSVQVGSADACTWTPSLAADGQTIVDLTVSRQGTGSIVALATGVVDGGIVNVLEESANEGASFGILGSPLPLDTVYTVDIAPSDASRIYVTGLDKDQRGQLLVSVNHGSSWTAHDIPGTNVDEAPYIAAVHPHDPSIVYVRTNSWTNRDVVATANDALLYTSDEGKTWKEVVRKQAKLLGFALAPDASSVLVGYGDPVQSARQIDREVMGLYKSPVPNFSFTRMATGSVTCLAWTHTGMYACMPERQVGFQLGFAESADLVGDRCSLAPLLRLRDVAGPLACPGGSSGALCAADWPSACNVLGACDTSGTGTEAGCIAPPASDGAVDETGIVEPGDGETAGAGGQTTGPGDGTITGDGGAGLEAGAAGKGEGADHGGADRSGGACACSTLGKGASDRSDHGSAWRWWLAFGLLAGVVRARGGRHARARYGTLR